MSVLTSVRPPGTPSKGARAALLLVSALCAMAVQSGDARPAEAQQRVAATVPVAALAATRDAAEQPDAMRFAVGDKLRINVFERLADAEDRWANQQRAARPDASFFLHQGMSGEVVVRADWRISVPLLGTFLAANRDPAELAVEIGAAFERLINRRGVVSIDLIARQPIYVLGAVRNPGPYAFEAGLTPLHAIALAGGLRVQELDRGTAAEAVRELGRSEVSIGRLQVALAKLAVLRGGQTQTRPAVPLELVQLVGYQQAEALLAEAAMAREPVGRALQERDRAVAAAIEAARQSVAAARERLAPSDASVEQRRVRTEGMQALYQSGNVHRMTLAQVQSEFAEATDRQVAARAAVVEAERILTSLELDRSRMAAEVAAGLEAEIATLQRDIDEISGSLASGSRFASLVQPSLDAAESDTPLRFEVVRRSRTGSEIILAEPTMALQPGDLVRLLDRPAQTSRMIPRRALPPSSIRGSPAADLVATRPPTPPGMW